MNINQIIAHEVKLGNSLFYRIDKNTWVFKMNEGVVLRVAGPEANDLEKQFQSKLKQDFDDDVYA